MCGLVGYIIVSRNMYVFSTRCDKYVSQYWADALGSMMTQMELLEKHISVQWEELQYQIKMRVNGWKDIPLKILLFWLEFPTKIIVSLPFKT